MEEYVQTIGLPPQILNPLTFLVGEISLLSRSSAHRQFADERGRAVRHLCCSAGADSKAASRRDVGI